MKKVLFLIHDLGQGGAEKVLVNLVNNMDRSKFEISVMTLFDVGVNRQFLSPSIAYRTGFNRMVPGNSKLMKLFTPRQLHRWIIHDRYDIEIAYLEGPSARVISGCTNSETKLVAWIHGEKRTPASAAASFRSIKEATQCYNKFHRIITVSQTVCENIACLFPISVPVSVLYNTNESEKIYAMSKLPIQIPNMPAGTFKLLGVGRLLKNKGFDRLLQIEHRLLTNGYQVHLFILGMGPEEKRLRTLASDLGISHRLSLLGYQTNPYRYMANCDLFVCASLAEGFSTAATEALIVGTPVCTVEVSGMKEMLGENNEWGVVTENTEEALYQGIKDLLEHPDKLRHYKQMAEQRGRMFSTENTVRAVEEMLMSL